MESREDVGKMLAYDQDIDLIIPRGSNELVQTVMNGTKIPVLGHADGICHIYVDEDCDLDQAIEIIIDAKTQYPSACNAVETLLIHETQFSEVQKRLTDQCPQLELLSAPESWSIEYGDLRLAVKSVRNMAEAVDHINTFGSHHTEAILTSNQSRAEEFLHEVDSSSVFVNCSTRFADGFRYGFGAEVGISTNKTHARGPVGLEGLVIYKYLLRGQGQVVASYSGSEARPFTHRNLS